MILTDTANDLMWTKSVDGGLSWDEPNLIDADTMVAQSIWYDRWSGIDGDEAVISWIEAGTDIIHSRVFDTSTDTLGTDITVFDGDSTAAGGTLSVCRATDGYIYIAGMIDAGTEGGLWVSEDDGATYMSKATPFEGETQDQIILMPSFADGLNIMAFFWDASTNELSRKIYTYATDSWAETLISASMTDRPFSTDGPHFAATVDLANSRNLLVAWSAVDTANADLRCWHITESAITEVTNVVLNSGGNQAYAAIGIDINTARWHVFYGGASDGSETVTGAGGDLRIYTKTSDDAGTTWSAETVFSTLGIQLTSSIICAPRFFGSPIVAWYNNGARSVVKVNVNILRPRANLMLGI